MTARSFDAHSESGTIGILFSLGVVVVAAINLVLDFGFIEQGAEPKIDLPMAKFNIDMLGVVEEKTKGNLTDEEKEMLDSTLQQLRMAFVQVTQAQQQQ